MQCIFLGVNLQNNSKKDYLNLKSLKIETKGLETLVKFIFFLALINRAPRINFLQKNFIYVLYLIFIL